MVAHDPGVSYMRLLKSKSPCSRTKSAPSPSPPVSFQRSHAIEDPSVTPSELKTGLSFHRDGVGSESSVLSWSVSPSWGRYQRARWSAGESWMTALQR